MGREISNNFPPGKKNKVTINHFLDTLQDRIYKHFI